jgi:hypothetical protein
MKVLLLITRLDRLLLASLRSVSVSSELARWQYLHVDLYSNEAQLSVYIAVSRRKNVSSIANTASFIDWP